MLSSGDDSGHIHGGRKRRWAKQCPSFLHSAPRALSRCAFRNTCPPCSCTSTTEVCPRCVFEDSQCIGSPSVRCAPLPVVGRAHKSRSAWTNAVGAAHGWGFPLCIDPLHHLSSLPPCGPWDPTQKPLPPGRPPCQLHVTSPEARSRSSVTLFADPHVHIPELIPLTRLPLAGPQGLWPELCDRAGGPGSQRRWLSLGGRLIVPSNRWRLRESSGQ